MLAHLTFVERVLLKTFQNLKVSSPAPVTMASPSGDIACGKDRSSWVSLSLCRQLQGWREARRQGGGTGDWAQPEAQGREAQVGARRQRTVSSGQ
jgi:hypothetical protein